MEFRAAGSAAAWSRQPSAALLQVPPPSSTAAKLPACGMRQRRATLDVPPDPKTGGVGPPKAVGERRGSIGGGSGGSGQQQQQQALASCRRLWQPPPHLTQKQPHPYRSPPIAAMSSPPVAPAAHQGPDAIRPTPPGALQCARVWHDARLPTRNSPLQMSCAT